VTRMVEMYETYLAGMNKPNRPLGTLMFLGPTGTGKTRLVEAVAESFYGDPGAVLKIDCSEFQHSHEICKLIGSPPGYLGHRETHPALAQDLLDRWHTDSLKVSLLLFDEIEKASDALWKLMLGIMDKATLTMGDNRRVDFSRTFIFMTSNVGAGDIAKLQGSQFGFGTQSFAADDAHHSQVESTAIAAAKRKFSPEFMNRIDKMVVFRTLTKTDIEQILELELAKVQERILKSGKGFLVTFSKEAKKALLDEGYNAEYGGRELNRVIERKIVQPLARLASSGQAGPNEIVAVTYKKGEYRFTRELIKPEVSAVFERLAEIPLQPTSAKERGKWWNKA